MKRCEVGITGSDIDDTIQPRSFTHSPLPRALSTVRPPPKQPFTQSRLLVLFVVVTVAQYGCMWDALFVLRVMI
jgi:hypothetical protein